MDLLFHTAVDMGSRSGVQSARGWSRGSKMAFPPGPVPCWPSRKGALSWAPARRSQPGCIPVRQVFSNIAEATWLFSPAPDVTGHPSHWTPLGEAVPKPLDSKGRPWAVPPDERNMEESGADLRAVMGPLLFVLPFVKKVIPL